MTASNHAVTGALIAAAIPYPAVGLALALLSHFMLDALPHYGAKDHVSNKFLYFLSADAGIAAAILLSITILHPEHWLIAVIGAVLAMIPDLMWLPSWISELQHKRSKKFNAITTFHKRIQWYERPAGGLIEIGWFACMLPMLAVALSR